RRRQRGREVRRRESVGWGGQCGHGVTLAGGIVVGPFGGTDGADTHGEVSEVVVAVGRTLGKPVSGCEVKLERDWGGRRRGTTSCSAGGGTCTTAASGCRRRRIRRHTLGFERGNGL